MQGLETPDQHPLIGLLSCISAHPCMFIHDSHIPVHKYYTSMY